MYVFVNNTLCFKFTAIYNLCSCKNLQLRGKKSSSYHQTQKSDERREKPTVNTKRWLVFCFLRIGYCLRSIFSNCPASIEMILKKSPSPWTLEQRLGISYLRYLGPNVLSEFGIPTDFTGQTFLTWKIQPKLLQNIKLSEGYIGNPT